MVSVSVDDKHSCFRVMSLTPELGVEIMLENAVDMVSIMIGAYKKEIS